MRSIWFKLAFATVLLASQVTVHAVPYVNGSLTFNGVPVFDNPNNLAAATAFTAINNVTVAVGQQTGDYTALPDGLPASISAFTFSPATPPVIPLWTLTYNGITYSFDATSMVAHYNAAAQIWNMSGSGIAHITGELDTPGEWKLAAGKQGASFFLGAGSAAEAPAPDGGTTVWFLGTALSGLALFRRKLC